MTNIRNIKDLKARKEALKNEVSELEKFIKFKNPVAFLGHITDRFTNKFLRSSSSDNINNKILSFITENAIKSGSTTLINRIAGKAMKNTSWKYKIIGSLIMYIIPTILKKIRNRQNKDQKKENL